MTQAGVDPADVEKLKGEVEAFCTLIEHLPERALREQAWGPREVLAHLVYWHEQYAAQLQARLAGRPYPLPHGRFRELNDYAVEDARRQSIAAQLARFRAANRRWSSLIADPRAQGASIQIKQDSKIWPAGELLPRVAAHIRKHRLELTKSLRA